MKKVLSIVLSLAMVVCMMPLTAFAASNSASYSDIEGEKCEGAVNVLTALGVVDGYEDGTYRPSATVTRAEMAKLIITALGVADYASATTSTYTDMANAQWAVPFVQYATNLNIINGYGNGKFGPSDQVTYEQAATMIVRALGFTDNCNEMNGSWPAIYVQKATALGLFNGVAGSGSVGANRGDIAIMLYNALNVPEVYADNDGATQNKYGSDGAYVTMMDTLNVNGSSQYKIVTDADADTAVNSIAGYVGAAAEVIYNEDGDVLALSDIKTQFLSGEYKTNGKFEADNGTTYSIASDAYKKFVSPENGENTTGKVQNAKDGVVTIENGISSDNTKKFDKTTDGGKDFTIAATVSGKTITGIYSIATWDVTTADKVDSSDLNQIERNQKLLSKEFALDDDQEIDTSSFILNGVDSLSDIKADNIVYVYVGDNKIKRVDVGTKTVTGTISKTTSTKVTIDGTAYEISEQSDLDGTAGKGDLVAGNEVTLYLDYAGDIYDADLVDGSAGNFAVIINKSGTVPSKSSVSGTAKVELLTADGSKVFEINGNKYIDNTSLGVTTDANGDKVLADSDWNNIAEGTIVQYSVNDSGQVTKMKALDNADYASDTVTKTTVTKAGYLNLENGSQSIADSALIFAVPQNKAELDFDWTADSEDFAIVKKAAILDTSVSRATYVVDVDTNKIVCMIIDDSSTSDDQYGIVTATADIDGGVSADFYIGTEKITDGEITGTTPVKASEANGGLYKISKTTSGDYKFDPATEVAKYTATKDAEGNLTSSVTVKNGYVQFSGNANRYNLYNDVVVYVYDEADDAYSIGTTSDLTDDTLKSAKIYMTSSDSSDDSYKLIDYIVITME